WGSKYADPGMASPWDSSESLMISRTAALSRSSMGRIIIGDPPVSRGVLMGISYRSGIGAPVCWSVCAGLLTGQQLWSCVARVGWFVLSLLACERGVAHRTTSVAPARPQLRQRPAGAYAATTEMPARRARAG